MFLKLHPGPDTSRLKNRTQCSSVKEVEADKKGMKIRENPGGSFVKRNSHRALGLVVLYWVGTDIEVNLIGTEIQILLETPSGQGAGSSSPGTRMTWLQPPATKQTVSVSTKGDEANPHQCDISVPMELDSSEGHESHYSSSHPRENVYLLLYSDDQSTRDKHRKNTFLRRAVSTSAKYDRRVRRRLEHRRLRTVNRCS